MLTQTLGKQKARIVNVQFKFRAFLCPPIWEKPQNGGEKILKTTILYFIVAAFSFTFSVFPLHAAPVNYTFEVTMPGSPEFSGTVNSNVTPGSYLYDQGFLNLGTVYYAIQVDFDVDGSFIRADGSKTTYSDTTYVDYFYADYVSGPLATGGGVSGAKVQEYNYGNTNTVNTPTSLLRVGSQDSWLSFSRIADWTINPSANIGLSMNTYNGDGSLNSNIMVNNVNIVEISQVPLPAAFWLLGSGLAAMLGYKKRK